VAAHATEILALHLIQEGGRVKKGVTVPRPAPKVSYGGGAELYSKESVILGLGLVRGPL